MSIPNVKAVPEIDGPAALPIAENEVANPFSVPSNLKLRAEFVNRIVTHGNANTPAQHLTSITHNRAICCVVGVGKRTAKGVRM